MVMRTPPHSGILDQKEHLFGKSVKLYAATFQGEVLKLLPAQGEKVESYGAANDLLHV